MKLTDLKVKEFVAEVAQKSPAPGGGSVSDLVAVLGGALACMVGGLTVGKKRYETFDEAEKNAFSKATSKIDELRHELFQLIDQDTQAFNSVMNAFRLPKDTDQDKEIRKEAIEKATVKAIEVPMKAAEIAYAMLRELQVVLKFGNPNTLSDIGVSALLMGAGIEGSVLNVKINLPGLSNKKVAEEYRQKVDCLLSKTRDFTSRIVNEVHYRLEN